MVSNNYTKVNNQSIRNQKSGKISLTKRMNLATLLSVTLLSVVAICVFLTLFQGLIPYNLVRGNAEQSLQQLYGEDTYPIVSGHSVDNFSNRIMVQETNNGFALSPNVGVQNGERSSLSQFNKIQRIFYSGSYDRYWHGYLIYLKPLLVLFDYNAIRIIMAICFAALTILCLIKIAKRISTSAAVAFLVAIVVSNPETIIMGTQHFTNYLILFVTILVMIRLFKKPLSNRRILPLFLVVGGATSFMDLLSAPLVTLGIPLLLLVLFMKQNKIELAKIIKTSVAAGICWVIGYALTWLSKWLITSTILGQGDKMLEYFKAILYRTGGAGDGDRLHTISINVEMIPALNCLAIVAIVLLVVTIIRHRRASINELKFDAFLLILALMPFVWLVVANNHSQVHYWMTYRILAISVMALVVIIIRQLNLLGSLKFSEKKLN
jgi:hypothetical protein